MMHKTEYETFAKLPYSEFVPTPYPSHENREGLKLLYSGDFVPTPLFENKKYINILNFVKGAKLNFTHLFFDLIQTRREF